MSSIAWNSNYELLLQYLDENNGVYPRTDEIYFYVNLGAWISKQRTIYNNGETKEDGSIKYRSYRLTKEEIDKLDVINFPWRINKEKLYSDLWDERFELLKEYIKEHNGNFPNSKEQYKGINLGFWVNTQRTIYNNGKILEDGSRKYNINVLNPNQIDKLNSINFSWCMNREKITASLWNEKYELLKKYLEEHNGKHPSQSTYYKKAPLGRWINTQRLVYYNGIKDESGTLKYGNSILNKEQIEKLDSIGFIWAPLSKREYMSVIRSEKMKRIIKRKVLCKLKLALEQSKNEIESKEDIKKIEEEFIKQLTIFN